MEDVVEGPLHLDEMRHVVVHEREARMVLQVGDILPITGDQVVHADDIESLLDEAIAEMGAEEACSAGDEDSWHGEDPGSWPGAKNTRSFQGCQRDARMAPRCQTQDSRMSSRPARPSGRPTASSSTGTWRSRIS